MSTRVPTAKRSRWQRFAGWGLAAIAGAIISASITTDRVDWAGELVGDLFDDGVAKPTATELLTAQIGRQVRTATVWDGRPTMYPASLRFILDHFREVDPRRPHRHLLPRPPIVFPDQLVQEMPVYAGHRITVVGKVVAMNVARSRLRHLAHGGFTSLGRCPFKTSPTSPSSLRPTPLNRWSTASSRMDPSDGSSQAGGPRCWGCRSPEEQSPLPAAVSPRAGT